MPAAAGTRLARIFPAECFDTRNNDWAGNEWILGETWRASWTTPVEVPGLDLERTAGGLGVRVRHGPT